MVTSRSFWSISPYIADTGKSQACILLVSHTFLLVLIKTTAWVTVSHKSQCVKLPFLLFHTDVHWRIPSRVNSSFLTRIWMGSLTELHWWPRRHQKALQPTVKLTGTAELLKYIIDMVFEPMASCFICLIQYKHPDVAGGQASQVKHIKHLARGTHNYIGELLSTASAPKHVHRCSPNGQDKRHPRSLLVS